MGYGMLLFIFEYLASSGVAFSFLLFHFWVLLLPFSFYTYFSHAFGRLRLSR